MTLKLNLRELEGIRGTEHQDAFPEGLHDYKTVCSEFDQALHANLFPSIWRPSHMTFLERPVTAHNLLQLAESLESHFEKQKKRLKQAPPGSMGRAFEHVATFFNQARYSGVRLGKSQTMGWREMAWRIVCHHELHAKVRELLSHVPNGGMLTNAAQPLTVQGQEPVRVRDLVEQSQLPLLSKIKMGFWMRKKRSSAQIETDIGKLRKIQTTLFIHNGNLAQAKKELNDHQDKINPAYLSDVWTWLDKEGNEAQKTLKNIEMALNKIQQARRLP